jgi:hypothetical protein
MALHLGKPSLFALSGEYLRAILREKVPADTPDSTPFSPAFGAQERCRNMPPLTPTQATLLLYFLGSDRKLDPIRIMKGLFVFTMEAPQSWVSTDSRYRFFAHSWGPYSREVDNDLNKLSLHGYLQESQAQGKNWSYYSLTEEGRRKAQEVAQQFPAPAVAYLSTVREFLLKLSFRKLLDTIYARYPDYAANSLFKH